MKKKKKIKALLPLKIIIIPLNTTKKTPPLKHILSYQSIPFDGKYVCQWIKIKSTFVIWKYITEKNCIIWQGNEVIKKPNWSWNSPLITINIQIYRSIGNFTFNWITKYISYNDFWSRLWWGLWENLYLFI